MRKYFYTDKKKGLELICDNKGCGASVFLKRISERTYDSDEVYEDKPKGWAYDGNHTTVYCPDCVAKIAEMMKKI